MAKLSELLKKVIGPSKEDIEYMERLKRRPRPSPEQIQAQIRASRELRQSPEYQAKYNNKFYSEGRRKRGGRDAKAYTAEDLRAIEEWNKSIEASRKNSSDSSQT